MGFKPRKSRDNKDQPRPDWRSFKSKVDEYLYLPQEEKDRSDAEYMDETHGYDIGS